jgi:hypothetical protein
MRKEPKRARGVLRAAGRATVSLLRETQRRAKLGSMHLPIALQPNHQQAIVLPLGAPEEEVAAQAEPVEVAPPVTQETRALRSRLAAAERRIARLRHALERERQTTAQLQETIARPQVLIDHLVADLRGVDRQNEAAMRQTIATVLGAYGLKVRPNQPPPRLDRDPGAELPTIPGWDQKRVQALVTQVLADRPEIGGPRYVQVSLAALAVQGRITPAQLATSIGVTSPVGRHRVRLALEGLCAAGVARREGTKFVFVPSPPRQEADH